MITRGRYASASYGTSLVVNGPEFEGMHTRQEWMIRENQLICKWSKSHSGLDAEAMNFRKSKIQSEQLF